MTYTEVPLDQHKLFGKVSKVVDLSEAVLDFDVIQYVEFDKGEVPVYMHSLIAGNTVRPVEPVLRAQHEDMELYRYLNVLGFTIAINKLHTLDSDNDLLHPGFMKHLVMEHDAPNYRILPEMWANVWANNTAKLLDHKTVLYPDDLIMADVTWYKETLSALSDEVAAGEMHRGIEMYLEYVKTAFLDCGVVELAAKGESRKTMSSKMDDMLSEAIMHALQSQRGRRRTSDSRVSRIEINGREVPRELHELLKHIFE